MPTTKVTITLDPFQYDLLRDLVRQSIDEMDQRLKTLNGAEKVHLGKRFSQAESLLKQL